MKIVSKTDWEKKMKKSKGSISNKVVVVVIIVVKVEIVEEADIKRTSRC